MKCRATKTANSSDSRKWKKCDTLRRRHRRCHRLQHYFFLWNFVRPKHEKKVHTDFLHLSHQILFTIECNFLFHQPMTPYCVSHSHKSFSPNFHLMHFHNSIFEKALFHRRKTVGFSIVSSILRIRCARWYVTHKIFIGVCASAGNEQWIMRQGNDSNDRAQWKMFTGKCSRRKMGNGKMLEEIVFQRKEETVHDFNATKEIGIFFLVKIVFSHLRMEKEMKVLFSVEICWARYRFTFHANHTKWRRGHVSLWFLPKLKYNNSQDENVVLCNSVCYSLIAKLQSPNSRVRTRFDLFRR